MTNEKQAEPLTDENFPKAIGPSSIGYYCSYCKIYGSAPERIPHTGYCPHTLQARVAELEKERLHYEEEAFHEQQIAEQEDQEPTLVPKGE